MINIASQIPSQSSLDFQIIQLFFVYLGMITTKTYYASVNEIIPGLYLGNSDSAYDPDIVNAIDVSHILVMGEELQIKYPQKFIYKKIPLADSASSNLLQFVDEGIDFIAQGLKNKGVLVHCRFGISRSSAIIIAYLMKTKHQSFVASFNQVRNKRQFIKPNKGFVRQLLRYESTIKVHY